MEKTMTLTKTVALLQQEQQLGQDSNYDRHRLKRLDEMFDKFKHIKPKLYTVWVDRLTRAYERK